MHVIIDAVLDAIADGALTAGTKLGEDPLAALFGVSRTIVRQALQHLGFLGVVDLIPNRGAFIVSPDERTATETYAARRIIEASLIADAARHCTAADIRELRSHIERQRRAAEAGERREFIRLLGEFHILIAQRGGNGVLAKFLEQLVPRTALLLSLYEDPAHSCAVDEHVMLVDLMMKGDEAGCVALMERHLTANLDSLRIDTTGNKRFDLVESLRPYVR